MGQYFVAHNIDRDEQMGFGMLKFVERLSNQAWTAALAYLMFEGPQDGTVLTGKHLDDYLSLSDEKLTLLASSQYGSQRRVDDLESAETKDERRRAVASIATIAEANKQISESNRYAGRWAGDRVTIVGDYAESGLYDAPAPDISESVVEEMDENGVFEWLDADRPEVKR